MEIELYHHSLTEREFTTAFNMGLETAVYLIEEAEMLSPGGRRLLLKELKKKIAENNEVESPKLTLRCIK